MRALSMVSVFAIALAGIMWWDQEPTAPVVEIAQNDLEVERMKSRWYWLDSEVTGAKEFSSKQFYQGLRNEIESELEARQICVRKSYMQGTIWEACDIHAGKPN